MILFEKIKNKIIYLNNRYIKRDHFLLEVDRWFKDKGDQALRLAYPLSADSVVFDLGGYHGDFAADIHAKYSCAVYIFEPVPKFYNKCVNRFAGNSKITCFNYGLASVDGWLDIGLADNASSFESPHAKGNTERVEIRSIVPCINSLGITKIDLMKINIEGGEFDVLPALIDSGLIKNIDNLQVQFHNFIDNAAEKRNELRRSLQQTHIETWNYEFVWENWKIKGASL